jgi:hypothetical protein
MACSKLPGETRPCVSSAAARTYLARAASSDPRIDEKEKKRREDVIRNIVVFLQGFVISMILVYPLAGCSKTSGCKARDISKSEAYIEVRRNDEKYA